AAPPLVKQPLPPNTFTNLPTAQPESAALNILLLDSFNIPMAAQMQLRQRLLDFLDKMPAGTRVEILALDPHLSILQGFTDDRELLKAAINSRKPQFAPLEDPGQEPDALEVPLTLEQQGSHIAIRSENLTSSMKQIARYLGGLPGRKNLLWFSGSLPQQFPPQPPDPDVWPLYVIFDGT